MSRDFGPGLSLTIAPLAARDGGNRASGSYGGRPRPSRRHVGRDSSPSDRLGDEPVLLDPSDSVDLDATTSPSAISSGGSRRKPTPAGVPVRITSPGSSVVNSEMTLTRVGTSKIMQLGRASCTQLAVDVRCAGASAARIGDLVGGDQRRAQRGGGVPRLALEPLVGAVLEVAHRHIVGDGVPGDGVERAGAASRRRTRAPMTTASSPS